MKAVNQKEEDDWRGNYFCESEMKTMLWFVKRMMVQMLLKDQGKAD